MTSDSFSSIDSNKASVTAVADRGWDRFPMKSVLEQDCPCIMDWNKRDCPDLFLLTYSYIEEYQAYYD